MKTITIQDRDHTALTEMKDEVNRVMRGFWPSYGDTLTVLLESWKKLSDDAKFHVIEAAMDVVFKL